MQIFQEALRNTAVSNKFINGYKILLHIMISSSQFVQMEKSEIVDEIGHTFLTEQGYMVHADDIEGLININK